jgi:hypothetical protein
VRSIYGLLMKGHSEHPNRCKGNAQERTYEGTPNEPLKNGSENMELICCCMPNICRCISANGSPFPPGYIIRCAFSIRNSDNNNLAQTRVLLRGTKLLDLPSRMDPALTQPVELLTHAAGNKRIEQKLCVSQSLRAWSCAASASKYSQPRDFEKSCGFLVPHELRYKARPSAQVRAPEWKKNRPVHAMHSRCVLMMLPCLDMLLRLLHGTRNSRQVCLRARS